MLDLSKYFSKNSSSNFGRSFTIEEVKESQNNQPLRIIPSKNKPGKFFFACGNIRGYVAAKTAAKLNAKQPVGTLIITETTTAKGEELLCMIEQSENIAIAVF